MVRVDSGSLRGLVDHGVIAFASDRLAALRRLPIDRCCRRKGRGPIVRAHGDSPADGRVLPLGGHGALRFASKARAGTSESCWGFQRTAIGFRFHACNKLAQHVGQQFRDDPHDVADRYGSVATMRVSKVTYGNAVGDCIFG